jgi:hypothetical protein
MQWRLGTQLMHSESPTNHKYRDVYCPKCKRIDVTNWPAPVCEECFGTPMITILYSLIDSKPIRKEHELGPRSS